MRLLLQSPFISLLRALAQPLLLFWALPWLMVLLIAGTVAERYIGLYQSQRLFFGSFILWLGPVPVPGAYPTLGLIAASLCAKLLLDPPAKKIHLGTLLTHVSVLVLLLGGLFTALGREEGYMVLGGGQSSATVSDYNARALVISSHDAALLRIPQTQLNAGDVIQGNLPFSLTVQHYCYPCTAAARTGSDPALRGVAQHIALATTRSGSEENNHQAGVMIEVRGDSEAADGTYLVFEGLAKPTEIRAAQNSYTLTLAPEERRLPFSIKLLHFTKEDYPGTQMAKNYSSEVTVKDGVEGNATIGMNAPLRHGGYTFYQSSYLEQDGKLYSVLAVVRDRAEALPYIAIVLLCAGLALHLILTFGKKHK